METQCEIASTRTTLAPDSSQNSWVLSQWDITWVRIGKNHLSKPKTHFLSLLRSHCYLSACLLFISLLLKSVIPGAQNQRRPLSPWSCLQIFCCLSTVQTSWFENIEINHRPTCEKKEKGTHHSSHTSHSHVEQRSPGTTTHLFHMFKSQPAAPAAHFITFQERPRQMSHLLLSNVWSGWEIVEQSVLTIRGFSFNLKAVQRNGAAALERTSE